MRLMMTVLLLSTAACRKKDDPPGSPASPSGAVSHGSLPAPVRSAADKQFAEARFVRAEYLSIKGELGATAFDFAKAMDDEYERQLKSGKHMSREEAMRQYDAAMKAGKKPPAVVPPTAPPASEKGRPAATVTGAYLVVYERKNGTADRWYFILGEGGSVVLDGRPVFDDWREDVEGIVIRDGH